MNSSNKDVQDRRMIIMVVIILMATTITMNSFLLYTMMISLNNQNESLKNQDEQLSNQDIILEEIRDTSTEAQQGKLYVFLNETSKVFSYLDNITEILESLNITRTNSN